MGGVATAEVAARGAEGRAQRGRRLLPGGWVALASEPTPTSRGLYGAHFWLGGRGDLRSEGAGADACDALYPSRLSPSRGWWYDALPALFGFTWAPNGIP